MAHSLFPLINFVLSMMFLAFLLVGAHALSCLNEFSEPVDWWITLKMPKIAGVYPEGTFVVVTCQAIRTSTVMPPTIADPS